MWHMSQTRQAAQATSKQTSGNKEEKMLQGEMNMVGNMMSRAPQLLSCLDRARSFRSEVTATIIHAREQL